MQDLIVSSMDKSITLNDDPSGSIEQLKNSQIENN